MVIIVVHYLTVHSKTMKSLMLTHVDRLERAIFSLGVVWMTLLNIEFVPIAMWAGEEIRLR